MNVSKRVVFVSLIIVVVFWTTLLFLLYQANKDEDNFFNSNLRESFIESPFLRKLFHLDFDGDARVDYFGRKIKRIVLEIDVQKQINLDTRIVQNAKEVLTTVTQKLVEVDDTSSPFDGFSDYTDVDKNLIVKSTRDRVNTSDEVVLHVLFLTKEQSEDFHLGTTYGSDTVIIYLEALAQYVEYNRQSLNEYAQGTLLHEIGHQLGLAHNEEPGCLMSERAEVGGEARWDPTEVLTAFCQFETDLLEKFRNKYY